MQSTQGTFEKLTSLDEKECFELGSIIQPHLSNDSAQQAISTGDEVPSREEKMTRLTTEEIEWILRSWEEEVKRLNN